MKITEKQLNILIEKLVQEARFNPATARMSKQREEWLKKREEIKAKSLEALKTLPKSVKVLPEKEFSALATKFTSSPKFDIWKHDEEGILARRGGKYVLNMPLPKVVYHGTNLLAGLQILKTGSKKNFNLAANPSYAISYAASALEDEGTPSCVLKIDTSKLDPKLMTIADDYDPSNMEYKGSIPASAIKIMVVGVPGKKR